MLIGKRSELTVSSCQLRFMGRVCIRRNFEISLRRRGIVYGIRVHSAQLSAHGPIFLGNNATYI